MAASRGVGTGPKFGPRRNGAGVETGFHARIQFHAIESQYLLGELRFHVVDSRSPFPAVWGSPEWVWGDSARSRLCSPFDSLQALSGLALAHSRALSGLVDSLQALSGLALAHSRAPSGLDFPIWARFGSLQGSLWARFRSLGSLWLPSGLYIWAPSHLSAVTSEQRYI